jgi:hypothetical protein
LSILFIQADFKTISVNLRLDLPESNVYSNAVSNKNRRATVFRFEAGFLISAVRLFKINVAQKTNVLDAVKKQTTQLRKAICADSVAALLGRHVDAFQINHFVGFRYDVGFEDQFFIVKNDIRSALFDAAERAF